MDNVIKEIKLQLGEKEVSLTVEQAKKLKESLDELFGKEVIREVHDYWQWYPRYWYCTPSIPAYTPGWYSSSGTAVYSNNTLTLAVA